MGLGDFTPDDSSKRGEYVQFSKEDFEDFLKRDAGYEPVELQDTRYVDAKASNFNGVNFQREVVYVINTEEIPNDLHIRIYSTVDRRTGMAREKGTDAIRTVLWSEEDGRPIGGRTKTLRIHTWRKNLLKKIESLVEETEDYFKKCDECGSYMVKREGEYGEFYGCLSYPECDNTEQVDASG